MGALGTRLWGPYTEPIEARVERTDGSMMWRRRMTARRTVAVCGATMVATSPFLAFMTTASPAKLALVGGPLGLVFGAAVAVLLRRVHWLTEWALLYERDT